MKKTKLVDLKGEKRSWGDLSGAGQDVINLNALNSGLYIVKLVADDGVRTMKLIVR